MCMRQLLLLLLLLLLGGLAKNLARAGTRSVKAQGCSVAYMFKSIDGLPWSAAAREHLLCGARPHRTVPRQALFTHCPAPVRTSGVLVEAIQRLVLRVAAPAVLGRPPALAALAPPRHARLRPLVELDARFLLAQRSALAHGQRIQTNVVATGNLAMRERSIELISCLEYYV